MRILMAVDGSEHSRRARFLLARACGAGKHQVTVFNATPPLVRGPDGLASITEALKESARRMTDAVAAELRQVKGFMTQPVVKEGEDAASAVLEEAESMGARLIVIGARGLTPFKSFLMGSVSQKVSRTFPGSVMIARTWPFKKELRVLVCVDGSLGGRRALDFVPALGLPKDARLTLINVADSPLASQMAVPRDPGFVAGGYDALMATQRRYRESLRRAGARYLAEAQTRLRGLKPRPKTMLVEGHPVQQILKAAGALGTDLIVVGRRGLSKTERFFMGSVSHKVSAHAPCSVLIVK